MVHIPRFIMIGGFLGSGKTTLLGQLARALNAEGKTVGLITNDQAEGLVDTLNLRNQGFSVEEITGGCFCCKFNSLTEATKKLTEKTRPHVFLGEPVGSCTDLIATVAIPLKKIYGDRFTVAPLTVLVDPFRATKILTNQKRGGFSPKVAYIYKKQLEEANAIAINKTDLLETSELKNLTDLIGSKYPNKPIFSFTAKNDIGLENWKEFVMTETVDDSSPLDIDYDIYADGEADLGWVNCSIKLFSETTFNSNQLLKDIAVLFQKRMRESNGEIAHLKMSISSGSEVGILSLVQNEAIPELSQEIHHPLKNAIIILNCRAEFAPENIIQFSEEAIIEACCNQEVGFEFLKSQAFRPDRPEPVHRMNET